MGRKLTNLGSRDGRTRGDGEAAREGSACFAGAVGGMKSGETFTRALGWAVVDLLLAGIEPGEGYRDVNKYVRSSSTDRSSTFKVVGQC